MINLKKLEEERNKSFKRLSSKDQLVELMKLRKDIMEGLI